MAGMVGVGGGPFSIYGHLSQLTMSFDEIRSLSIAQTSRAASPAESRYETSPPPSLLYFNPFSFPSYSWLVHLYSSNLLLSSRLLLPSLLDPILLTYPSATLTSLDHEPNPRGSIYNAVTV